MRRTRYTVRHTVKGRDGETTTHILAADPAEAAMHAHSHIVNLDKVLAVTVAEKRERTARGFRW